MKKDIFNFNRFGKYFVSDIKTCTANYGLSLITLSFLTLLALYIFHTGTSLILGNGWDGPDAGLRFFAFGVVMFCIVIVMPVKCYGKLTEKQYGSQWLMIPASKLEKFLSMIILSCIIIPVTGGLLYLGLDALICSVDPTCGNSLFRWAFDLESRINEIFVAEQITAEPEFELVMGFLKQLKSPWLYIDDGIQMVLPFLLGALCFKSGKTVKTFLVLAGASTALSIICAPLMVDWTKAMMEISTDANVIYADKLFNSWLLKNIALVDTISDTVTNLAFMAAIYFRIKTLKH